MNYLEKLQDIFPYRPPETLQQVIADVEYEIPTGDDEERLERMCTLLIEGFGNETAEIDDNAGYSMNNGNDILKEQLLRRFPDASPQYIGDVLKREDVTKDYNNLVQYFQTNGYKKNIGNEISDTMKNEIREQILQIFPDICGKYLDKSINKGLDLDALIEKFSCEDYIKTGKNNKIDPELLHFHKRLCDMLPKFDPDFLMSEAQKLPHLNETALNNCISYLFELEKYPTIAEYKKRQEQRSKMLNYIFHLKIDGFLKEFSNNLKTFENSQRKHSLSTGNIKDLDADRRFATEVLCYVYPGLRRSEIESKLRSSGYDIIQCCDLLGDVHKYNLQESEFVVPENTFTNKLMFQELAYVIYQKLIKNYLKIRNNAYEKAYKEAEAANLLRTCKTCYEEGLLLMPDECFQCMNGCDFCKQCMIRGAEIAYSDGLLEIDCFDRCGAKFSDYILQMVMDPIAYFKLMQRKQIKAIRDANVDGLETCPFCDYCSVMAKEDKIFICRNSECGKESCRECRHDSHIPLRCNEIEYDEDVRMRTEIENQMSAALIRTCKKCGNSIIKETGCNKMTCTCGQTMCYVCGESGINYNHFGTTCPQQSNQEQLHRNDVLRAVQATKARLGVDQNPNKLKFDPSKNF